MSRKWLVIGLGVVVVLLLLAAGVGWWWLMQYNEPFLVEAAPYRLSKNWYIGEFQPIFLGKLESGGNAAFRIAYRRPSGLLKLGNIMVGGQGGNETIAPLEINESFRLGQRIRVQYLLYTKSPEETELDTYCSVNPRLCQVARVVAATQESETPQVNGGMEPQLPVWATEIGSQKTNQETQ